MSVDLTTNLLAYEPVFLARLATVAGLAEVGGYAEYDRALRGGVVDDDGTPPEMQLPAAYLLYGGTGREAAPRGGNDNRPLILAQDWQVIVLGRPDITQGATTSLAGLGATLSAILAVFKDWQPEQALFPVEHVWPENDAIVAYGHGLVEAALLFQVKFKLS